MFFHDLAWNGFTRFHGQFIIWKICVSCWSHQQPAGTTSTLLSMYLLSFSAPQLPSSSIPQLLLPPSYNCRVWGQCTLPPIQPDHIPRAGTPQTVHRSGYPHLPLYTLVSTLHTSQHSTHYTLSLHTIQHYLCFTVSSQLCSALDVHCSKLRRANCHFFAAILCQTVYLQG